MSIADADAERQPKLGRVRGVEIFQAGLRKGQRYTEQHLDDIIENFRKFSTGDKKLIDPYVACGHDDKDLLGDGNPRYGTPAELWKEKGPCEECGGTAHWHGEPCPYCDNPDGHPTGQRTILKGTLAEVPLEIGDWIKRRQYDHGSAEFYPQGHPAIQGIPTKGFALKGFKLLGQTAPAVKTLAPLRDATWETYADLECEPAVFRFCDIDTAAESSILMCFSEVVKVDPKAAKKKALTDLGLSADFIAKMSDAEVDTLAEKMKPPAPTIITFTDLDMAEAYRFCSNMGMHAEPSTLSHPGGKSKDSLRLSHSFGDVHRIMKDNGYEHQGSGEFAHKANGHKMKFDHDDEGRPHVVKYSEDTDVNAKEIVAEVVAQLKPQMEAIAKATVDASVKTFSEQFDPIKKDVIDFKSSTHRDAIQKFCEEQLEVGRVYAFELDDTAKLPTIVDRLAKLDTAPVYKFSEGGKESVLSDLDLAKRDILQRPIRFAEKGKQGKDGKGTSDSAGGLQGQIEKFAEDNAKLVAEFGYESPKVLVDTFKMATDKDRKEFLDAMQKGLEAA